MSTNPDGGVCGALHRDGDSCTLPAGTHEYHEAGEGFGRHTWKNDDYRPKQPRKKTGRALQKEADQQHWLNLVHKIETARPAEGGGRG